MRLPNLTRLRRALTVLALALSSSAHAVGTERLGLQVSLGDVPPVTISVTTPRSVYFLGEPVPVTLQVRIDSSFLDERMVQLFRRKLDVPVQIRADWLDQLEGAEVLPAPNRGEGNDQRSIALNDNPSDVAAARVSHIDGQSFTTLELARTLVPSEPGRLALDAASVRYAFAESFQEDVFQGRVPVGREDDVAFAEGLSLAIEPWPTENQPVEFVDAVGNFTLRAELDRRRVVVGESLKLTLAIDGEGNLDTLTPPRLDQLSNFRVLGVLDTGRTDGAGPRTIVYDLAPADRSVDAVPPVSFAFLDPGPPPEYRTVTSSRFTIAVSAAKPSEPAARSLAEEQPAESARSRVWLTAVGGVLAVIGLALLVRRR